MPARLPAPLPFARPAPTSPSTGSAHRTSRPRTGLRHRPRPRDRLLRAFTTPAAAGACRSTRPRSIRAISQSSWPSRTSASTSTAASTARARARRLLLVAPRPHPLRRLDADHAGRAPARRPPRAHRQRQAAPDRRARCSSSEHLDKTEILRLYLRLAPFGGNIEGVRAASLAYFGKEPRHLSAGEAALLVALPAVARVAPPRPQQRGRAPAPATACSIAPSRPASSTPSRGRARARPSACRRRAASSRCSPRISPKPRSRPTPATPVHRLTIDRDLQAALEDLAEEQTQAARPEALGRHHGRRSHHRRGARPRRLGRLPRRRSRLGAIDMTDAVRSPGSTLKPFIYGLAFEAGLAHPETLIEDRADALRHLRAEELRRGLPRHGDDPRGARQLAQRSGGEGAGRGRPRQARRPLPPRRRRAGVPGQAPSPRSPSRSAASA